MSAVARATPHPTSSAPSPAHAVNAGIIADPYIAGLYWVPIDQAAKALGISDRALRMKGDALKEAGLAKQMSPVVGGQLKWHFSTRYDARLAALVKSDRPAAVHGADSSGGDAIKRFLAMPKTKQDGALARVIAVKLFRQWRRNPTTVVSNREHQRSLILTIKARCGLEPKCIQRLYDWHTLVESIDLNAPSGTQLAALELVDRRGGNKDSGFSDLAWARFKALYLGGKMSVRQCWQAVRGEAEDQGWTWVSLRHAARLLNERVPASVQTYAREGYDVWQRYHLPSVEQDPDAWTTGQAWETDHSTCNFFVRVVDSSGNFKAARPQVTAFIDKRSRRIMGWVLSMQGNSDTIRQALHRALSRDDVSVPQYIILDNGKDFASAQFCGATKKERRASKSEDDPNNREWVGLFGLLDIEPRFCQPYNHNGKPIIESFWRVLQMGFDRTLWNWCGTDAEPLDPDKRAALEAAPEKLPTLEQMREKMAAWFEAYDVNAERNIDALKDENGRRLSPAQWYTTRFNSAWRPLVNKRDVLARVEQAWDRAITPTKNGVHIMVSGKRFGYGQHEPAIIDLVGSGKSVHVTYNPDDLNSVRVYDEAFRELCTAPLNTKHGGPTQTPLAKQALKDALSRKREHVRNARRQVDVAAAVCTDVELAMLEAHDRQRKQGVAETKARMKAEGVSDAPPAMRLVHSPLSDGGGGDESSSIPLRKAAGAEHDVIPRRAEPYTPLRLTDDDFAVLPDADEPDTSGVIDPDDCIVSDEPQDDAAWLEEGLS